MLLRFCWLFQTNSRSEHSRFDNGRYVNGRPQDYRPQDKMCPIVVDSVVLGPGITCAC